VELDVTGPAEIGLALRWLRRAWVAATNAPEETT
jgi:hypothetical protein